MYNFPNTPTVGEIFTPNETAPTYQWDGTAWRLTTADTSVSVNIGDAPPAAPKPGQLWWESDTGNSFLFYDDGSSQQWVQFNSSSIADYIASTPNDMGFGIQGAYWMWNDKADFSGNNVMSLSKAGNLVPLLGKPLSFLQRQVKTTTGAITLHSETRAYLVEVVGGGGGSGGASTPIANQAAGAGGGGGGAYASKWMVRAPNASPYVTVAAGGAAKTGGGQTNFQDNGGAITVYANGGGGAPDATANVYCYVANGATGGTASGGDLMFNGESGGQGFSFGATAGGGTVITATGGKGGSSFYGVGGAPSGFNGGNVGGDAGNVGFGYGAGAGGGCAVHSGAVVAGAAGTPGVCIITEFK